MEIDLLNKGVYSVPEAARLVSQATGGRVAPGSVHRWLWGYGRQDRGASPRYGPLWEPELPLLHERKVLSFRDLIEILFVAAFRKEGVSLQGIRRIIEEATELIADPYPLSNPQFRTDGKRIIAAALDPAEQRLVFDLESGQMYLDPFFDRLSQGIEYSEIMRAARWWPLGKERSVVIDPGRRFGKPIVAEGGVPTTVLHSAFGAEKSVEAVSFWYGVSGSSVEDAVEFEQRLDAA